MQFLINIIHFDYQYINKLFNSQKSNMEGSKTVLRFYGPTKIKDGLFMGDETAAHDLEWISINQITHIINCVGKEVKNLYEREGICYMTFPWTEKTTQVLFDQKDVNIKEVMRFIKEAQTIGGGVLVHSKISDSRSCCILSAYFMKRFGWNLLKTLEFLNSRKEDIELEPQFFQQLNSLQNKLAKAGLIKSENWNDEELETEELIIRNTFLNAKQKPNDDPLFLKTKNKQKKKQSGIMWKDREQRNAKIFVEMRYSQQDKISNSSIILCKKIKVKSILKGSNKIIDLKPNEPQIVKESRNRSSKSILEKDAKKKPIMTTTGIPNNAVNSGGNTTTHQNSKINVRLGSEKTIQNKENIKEIPQDDISSQNQQILRKGADKSSNIMNTDPNENQILNSESSVVKQSKKSSSGRNYEISSRFDVLNKKDEVGVLTIQSNNQGLSENISPPLTNNWVIKTDLRNFKGIQEQILKKESKPVIIVKPNLNVTILSGFGRGQNLQAGGKRSASEKKKDTMNGSQQYFFNNSNMGNKQTSMVASNIIKNGDCSQSQGANQQRNLKDRLLQQQSNIKKENVLQTLENSNFIMDDKFSRKERSNSAKPKNDQPSKQQRQLFTISNLMDIQTIIKPKWKM